jgi:hypothetical protein
MRLRAFNPSTDNLEKSYLSSSYPAGTSTLVTKNTNNILVGDKLLLGEMGREKSEIVTVATVNADKITLTLTTATSFSHSADDPLYDLRYDQIKFYRSTSGINGAYSPLATVAVDVDNADKETYYNDDTGLPSYYYEISFYNSPGAIESALSDPMAGEGYSRTQIGSIINEVLTEGADLDQTYVNVPQLLSWANEVNDDLSSQSSRPYRFLRKNPNWKLNTQAGINRVSLPTDMTFIDFIQYTHTYAGFTDVPEIEIIDLNEMNYLTAYNNSVINNTDDLLKVAIDPATKELILYPTPLTSQTNILTIYGWTNFNVIDGLGDTVQTPNSRIYKMFLLAKYWKIRSIKESGYQALSAAYQQDYNTEIIKLQRSNKIDKGTPTGMKPDTRNNLRLHDSYYRT